jgi:hypothetical protein
MPFLNELQSRLAETSGGIPYSEVLVCVIWSFVAYEPRCGFFLV